MEQRLIMKQRIKHIRIVIAQCEHNTELKHYSVLADYQGVGKNEYENIYGRGEGDGLYKMFQNSSSNIGIGHGSDFSR